MQTGRTYVEERQNFANWYSYYRRRMTGRHLCDRRTYCQHAGGAHRALRHQYRFKGWTLVQPVLNIKNDGEDYSETLLNLLYDFKFQGGTPLRRALEAGGRYFDKHDNKMLNGKQWR